MAGRTRGVGRWLQAGVVAAVAGGLTACGSSAVTPQPTTTARSSVTIAVPTATPTILPTIGPMVADPGYRLVADVNHPAGAPDGVFGGQTFADSTPVNIRVTCYGTGKIKIHLQLKYPSQQDPTAIETTETCNPNNPTYGLDYSPDPATTAQASATFTSSGPITWRALVEVAN